MGSFRASQMGGKIMDSDTDMGESSDEEHKVARIAEVVSDDQ